MAATKSLPPPPAAAPVDGAAETKQAPAGDTSAASDVSAGELADTLGPAIGLADNFSFDGDMLIGPGLVDQPELEVRS